MSVSGDSVGSAVVSYSVGYGLFNRTNETATLAHPVPCVYCWIIIPFYLVIVGVHTAVLCLVVSAKAVPCSIRFVLANIIVASIIVGLGTGTIIIARGTWSYAQHLSPSDGLCRFLIVATSVGGSGRVMFMAVFAVVVCVIIKYSRSAVKFGYLVVCASIVWLMCISFHAVLFAPDVLQVVLADNNGCLTLSAPYGQVYTVPYLVLFVLVPFLMTVTMPTTAYCCIKVNTGLENKTTVKPMVKFAIYLLLGNLPSCMGHAIPVTVAAINEGSHSEKVLQYSNRSFGVLVALSLIPTPILVLAYFKPVRYQMIKCTKYIWRRMWRRPSITTRQDWLTEMMLVYTEKAEQ